MSTKPDNPNRRQFIRLVGTTTVGAGAAYYGGTQYAGSPVQNAQAIPPVIAVGVAAAGIGWMLREHEVVGSNPPAEGLTADALESGVYDSAQARSSNNKSTFIDNRNIIDGIHHAAYADGKIAAIEELNDQKTESEVLDAAQAAVDEYATTLLSNLLKSWNESAREWGSFIDRLDEHEDTGLGMLDIKIDVYGDDFQSKKDVQFWEDDRSYDLPDGSTIDLHAIGLKYNYTNASVGQTGTIKATPVSKSSDDEADLDGGARVSLSGEDTIEYLNHFEWKPIVTDIEDAFENVNDGLATWVEGVYGDVQAGDLDTGELLTPREQAELTSDDEDFPQALADLEALNVSVDYEREAEVYLTEIGATLSGRLGYSGDESLEIGEYDPDEDLGGSVYLTYDVSKGSGNWDKYESGVDGGEVIFTEEPFDQTEYQVDTSAGEIATLTADDFDENGNGDAWVADISDQVDNAITEIEAVTFSAGIDDTKYETIQISDPFEIKSFTDSDGNEYASSNFEQSEPQTDDNYITEEEWKAQQERHNELIEKYEQSQQSGGGGIDLTALAGLPAEVVVVVVTAGAAFLYGK